MTRAFLLRHSDWLDSARDDAPTVLASAGLLVGLHDNKCKGSEMGIQTALCEKLTGSNDLYNAQFIGIWEFKADNIHSTGFEWMSQMALKICQCFVLLSQQQCRQLPQLLQACIYIYSPSYTAQLLVSAFSEPCLRQRDYY